MKTRPHGLCGWVRISVCAPSAEQPVQLVEVELGPLRVGVDDQVDALAAGDLGDGQLRRVRRDRHHHRPGTGEHVEEEPHPGGHVDHREDEARVDLLAVVPPREPGVRPPELAVVVEGRVAQPAVADRLLHRVGDDVGARVVHLGDPRGQHALGGLAPLEHQCAAGLGLGQVADHPVNLTVGDR